MLGLRVQQRLVAANVTSITSVDVSVSPQRKRVAEFPLSAATASQRSTDSHTLPWVAALFIGVAAGLLLASLCIVYLRSRGAKTVLLPVRLIDALCHECVSLRCRCCSLAISNVFFRCRCLVDG
jgi:hypothetical protein